MGAPDHPLAQRLGPIAPIAPPLSDATLAPPLDGPALIDAVRSLAEGPLAGLADAIDRQGTYPESLLRELGRLGAFQAHHAERGIAGASADYGLAIRAMAEVSRVCGATGFMVWCHLVCGVYLEQSGNPAMVGERLARHARGLTLGATGMSNPMKSFSGIERFLLQAVAEPDGGYRVNGTLPWVSNLGDDHCFGVVAPVVDAHGAPVSRPDGAPHEVMFLVRCDAPGVERRPCPSFAGMEGTNTWAVRLSDHRVASAEVVADPARPFIARIRGAFILLQTGMALGVTQGAIDSMWAVEAQLGHVNRHLEDRPDELQAELDALAERIFALAKTPYSTDREHLLEVLDTRAHGAELALRAAQSALLHAGARGYLMSSPVQRRVRESHFVAIVTPAIKHLRREISRLSEPALPS